MPIGPRDPGISVSTIGATTPVAPPPVASTGAWTAVQGSEIDAGNLGTVVYTIVNGGANTLQWRVAGAIAEDFSDEVLLQAAADVAASDSSAFVSSPAVYRFYRVEIIDKVGGQHGSATVHGYGKA